MGPGETAQQLEALVVLSEDPDPILNTHPGLTNIHSSSSVGSNPSLLTSAGTRLTRGAHTCKKYSDTQKESYKKMILVSSWMGERFVRPHPSP